MAGGDFYERGIKMDEVKSVRVRPTIVDVEYACDKIAPDEYLYLRINSAQRYLNDILQSLGYLSYETVCRILEIKPDPDLIDALEVLRYDPEKELGIYMEDDYKFNMWKVTLTYKEKKK